MCSCCQCAVENQFNSRKRMFSCCQCVVETSCDSVERMCVLASTLLALSTGHARATVLGLHTCVVLRTGCFLALVCSQGHGDMHARLCTVYIDRTHVCHSEESMF